MKTLLQGACFCYSILAFSLTCPLQAMRPALRARESRTKPISAIPAVLSPLSSSLVPCFSWDGWACTSTCSCSAELRTPEAVQA